MDEAFLRKHLALTEAHLARSWVHLCKQREIVAGLKENNRDTRSAVDFLRVVEKEFAEHRTIRDELRKKLGVVASR